MVRLARWERRSEWRFFGARMVAWSPWSPGAGSEVMLLLQQIDTISVNLSNTVQFNKQ